jgi:hypothetical protein
MPDWPLAVARSVCRARGLLRQRQAQYLWSQRIRTQQQTADLFQAEGAQESCRTHTPARLTSAQQSAAVVSGAEKLSSRHVLPRDLTNALKQLDDGELDRLFAATQRQVAASSPVIRSTTNMGREQRAWDQSTTTEESPNRRQPEEPNVALTQGQEGGASNLQGRNHTYPYSETIRDLPVRCAQGAGVRISKVWKKQVISRPQETRLQNKRIGARFNPLPPDPDHHQLSAIARLVVRSRVSSLASRAT